MRYFNTIGTCFPHKHYMVARESTLGKVVEQIDKGLYLIISRPRQYGKTTLIAELSYRVSDTYEIVRLKLDTLSKAAFVSEKEFTCTFCKSVLALAEGKLKIPDEAKVQMEQVMQRKTEMDLQDLMLCIRRWCRSSPKSVVLVLDEVDYAQESNVFRDFLSKLRAAYLEREEQQLPTFQSVILSGVSDVEHLKSGIRPEGKSTGTGSPWNIANNIEYPLELSTEGIAQMLTEYESDHHTGMEVSAVARAITQWTNGYPYLVSRMCQILDENAQGHKHAWTKRGVDGAAVQITKESNDLFSSLMQKVRDYPSLAKDLGDFMYRGKYLEYDPDDDAQKSMQLYGFIRVVDTHLEVANKIFRMRLTRWFDRLYREKHAEIIGEMREEYLTGRGEKYIHQDGSLDVYHILDDFIHIFEKVRRDTKLSEDEAERKFIEEDGRQMFILFLTPIINGYGSYSIEEQTVDKRRMDLVIYYKAWKYILELKIWHGAKYNAEGEKQLAGYLDYFGQDVGYMLSFSFNKNKEIGITAHHVGNKLLYEAIV